MNKFPRETRVSNSVKEKTCHIIGKGGGGGENKGWKPKAAENFSSRIKQREGSYNNHAWKATEGSGLVLSYEVNESYYGACKLKHVHGGMKLYSNVLRFPGKHLHAFAPQFGPDLNQWVCVIHQ